MPVSNTRINGTFKPLRKGIAVKEMEFGEQKTASGLIIASDDGKVGGIHPRWGEVMAIGPEQEDVSIGQWVLVAHGRWSRGFELNGETVRTVDPNDVLGIQDQAPSNDILTPTAGHQTRAYEGKVSVGKMEV
jgi:co-chaperonin GroES (HSP10)|uniref:Co-chaperonin GroES n=1 Tax=uncultured virus TaxID=340016 RepID=A0A221S4C4_9VIRU|nr:co-chaperonin GroES [uncultured virus]